MIPRFLSYGMWKSANRSGSIGKDDEQIAQYINKSQQYYMLFISTELIFTVQIYVNWSRVLILK